MTIREIRNESGRILLLPAIKRKRLRDKDCRSLFQKENEDGEKVLELYVHIPFLCENALIVISSPGTQTQLGGRNMWKRWSVRSNRQKNHIKSTV